MSPAVELWGSDSAPERRHRLGNGEFIMWRAPISTPRILPGSTRMGDAAMGWKRSLGLGNAFFDGFGNDYSDGIGKFFLELLASDDLDRARNQHPSKQL